MKDLEVLAVVSELYPLVKTGGLADVAGALPLALRSCAIRVRTLLPGYPSVIARLERPQVVRTLDDWYGGPATLLSARAAGLELYVLDAPHLYRRGGGPYGDGAGHDFPDNAVRFAALGRMAAEIGRGLAPRYKPSVIHAHDWQAGLTAAFMRYTAGPRVPVVCTIHNLAFQGQFGRDLLPAIGLPTEAFTSDGVEYYGAVGYLKASVRLADWVTTVSPTYAAEICTRQGGMGMDGLLRGRVDRLSGILNGIDTTVWDPSADPLIGAQYGAETLEARAMNKAELQARFGLAVQPDAPLFGVISRLSWQKGLDMLITALPALLAEGGQVVVLGSGDPDLEEAFRRIAADHAGQLACTFAYDERAAHQIQAGVDAVVVPSRFEPCGLTQLCALRYGAIPVVARVGGLADTVIDATPMSLAAGVATGVQFSPPETSMLESAFRRTIELYRAPAAWRRLQSNGMATDVSWTLSAAKYASLFSSLASGAKA